MKKRYLERVSSIMNNLYQDCSQTGRTFIKYQFFKSDTKVKNPEETNK